MLTDSMSNPMHELQVSDFNTELNPFTFEFRDSIYQVLTNEARPIPEPTESNNNSQSNDTQNLSTQESKSDQRLASFGQTLIY